MTKMTGLYIAIRFVFVYFFSFKSKEVIVALIVSSGKPFDKNF